MNPVFEIEQENDETDVNKPARKQNRRRIWIQVWKVILGLILALSLTPVAALAGGIQGDESAGGLTTTAAMANVSDATPVLEYETIFNGAEFDQGLDVAVNADGQAFVLGRAYDTNNDVMIVKLAADGSRLWVRYLRGSQHDYGTGIALDSAGDLYIGGWTDSADFPILNAIQPTKHGVTRDGFIAKLAGSDGSLIFSTFYGGSRSDQINDLVLSAAGEIYVVGQTESTDFPVVNPYQATLNLAQCFCDDAFVSKLNADASAILYSTYLGGERTDEGTSLGLDVSGNIYLAGTTDSPSFPVANPVQPNLGGGYRDAFLSRLSADGSQLVYSTYLGGNDYELASRLAVSDNGQAYLGGSTRSPDFPTTPEAFQTSFGGGLCGSPGFGQYNCSDMYLTSLLPDGSLAYSSYLGGDSDDEARGVAVNSTGEAYLAGYASSTNFPGAGGHNFAIILSKLDPSGSGLNYTLAIDSPVANAGNGLALDDQTGIYLAGAMNVPSDLYVAKFSEGGTPPPPPPPASVHVGDLDGLSQWVNGGRKWVAQVTIVVHDSSDHPVEKATVSAEWSGGTSGTGSCVTNAQGMCMITSSRINGKVSRVVFKIAGLSHGSDLYQASDNHDPDGDSDGTAIQVYAPGASFGICGKSCQQAGSQ